MPKYRIRKLATACFGIACAIGGLLYALQEIQEARLIDDLRDGGYVIYLRHADRNKGAKEKLNALSSAADFADCADQRNLTPAGRSKAVSLGEVIRALWVPVGRVVANPLCRTRDTAMLAFGHADLDSALYSIDHVRVLLQTLPPEHTNTILIGTEDQARRAIGIALAPAEAAIVKPDGKGHFRLIGSVPFDEWDS